VLGAVAVLAAILLLPALLPSLNPFREEDRDRSQPVLLKSLEDLSQYRAASANLQVVVDLERDMRHVPAFLKGERTTYLASGTVDAAVDFSRLGRSSGAVQVSDDRRAVTLTLPAAQLEPPRLDPSRSRVLDRDRGLLDRVADSVGDGSGADDQDLAVLAERKLAEAAASDPALLRTAERNTRSMLEGMLRALGFERITVRFARPAT
jgi:hypothetical protein